MGWSLRPFVFQKLTDVFVNKLRDPEPTITTGKSKSEKKWIRRRRRLAGSKLLQFVDDFPIFAEYFNLTMKLKEVTFTLLRALGLQIHPEKGYHTATQVGDHLGITIDMKESVFRAPKEKLGNISTLAKQLLIRFAKNKRWVLVKALASLARKAQLVLHLAIPVARFYLRELHDVVKSAASWTCTVRVSKQLKRDL